MTATTTTSNQREPGGMTATYAAAQTSVELARRLPNAEPVVHPDAGHGGIFQFHDQFVEKANLFLGGSDA